MRRMLSTLTIGAAIVFGTANAAQAETATGGTPRVNEGPNLDGAGTEVSEASADGATGAFSARAETVGANSFLPIVIRGFLPPNLIPGQGPSTAAASAGVDRAFAVQPGAYRVTISYRAARGVEAETGGGTARAYVQTSVSNGFQPLIAFDDLPDEVGTVERTFVVEVAAGVTTLAVNAVAVALANADGQGNGAEAGLTVGQTTFDVNRI